MNRVDTHSSNYDIGHHEDGSSYFWERFPQWHYIQKTRFEGINATDIRAAYFSQTSETEYYAKLPPGTQKYLTAFKRQPRYIKLCKDYLRKETSIKRINN